MVFVEPSSKNRSRGRPKAFSERELRDAEERATLSTRHRQNRVYAERARRRLADLGWWEELSEGLPVPLCVLTELGRIRDEARFRDAAWSYGFSAQRLTAKQAAETIKQMRTGITPEEGPGTLYVRLMRTVENFRIAYPDASIRYVEGQVELALQTVRHLRRYGS